MNNFIKQTFKMSRRGRSKNSVVSTAIGQDNENSATSSNTSEIMTFNGGHSSGPQTGYGSLNVIRERSPPTFDDTEINWPKYAAEFRLHLLDQNENDDIYTSTFTPTRNRQIYALLLKGVGRKSFEIIHKIYQDKGQEAFKFLEEFYIGSADQRIQKILIELTNTTLKDHHSIKDFSSKLLNWEAECKAFNLLPTTQKPGQASILVTLALRALPPRMSSFAGRCRERVGGLPDIKELVNLMVAEDQHQKQFSKTNETQNVSAASTNGRRRGSRGGRGGRGGRAGHQQQQQQSQQQQLQSQQ